MTIREDRALRLMLVINQLPVGGLERFVLWLAESMRAAGHSVDLVCLNHGGPVAEMAAARGIRTHILGGSTQPSLRGVAQFTRAAGRLAVLVADRRPDVVQTHLFGSQLAGSLAAAFAKVPVVVHVEQNYYHWKGRLTGILERYLAGGRGTWVTPTAVLAEHHRLRLGISNDRIRVIPNGIPLHGAPPRFARRRHPRMGSHVWAGLAERMVPAKRQSWLLKAAELACRAEPRLRWLLIGDGPARPQLEQAVADGPLAGRVHFAGEVQDPIPLLAELDVYATGSTMEGFGIAPMEALGLGVPVVAPSVPVLRETLEPSGGALLVPPRDPEEMARGVVLLARRPRLRMQLGHAGRQWVRRCRSAAGMTTSYEALYQRLLAGSIGQERH